MSTLFSAVSSKESLRRCPEGHDEASSDVAASDDGGDRLPLYGRGLLVTHLEDGL